MVFLVVNHGLITSNQQDEWISGYLVGGFKHEWTMTFHFIKKGCHPKPIDFHSMIFQRGRAQQPEIQICDWMIKSYQIPQKWTKQFSKNHYLRDFCQKKIGNINKFPRNSMILNPPKNGLQLSSIFPKITIWELGFHIFSRKKSGKKSPSESFALNKLGTSRDFPIRDGDFLRELP